jgi:hypothetical protein
MADPTGSNRPITTYGDFWPYYLQEHARPATRNIHFAGTFAALASLGAGLATGVVWWFPLALVSGYGPAWFAHFFVEKNRPATFTYPVWSLVSDFRMAWFWVTGALDKELDKAGVSVVQR